MHVETYLLLECMVVAAPLFLGILLSGLNIQAWMDLWAGSDFICR